MRVDPERLALICRANDIALLRIFGSASRGEENEQSDVDLLVRFRSRKTFLDLVRIEDELEQLFGRKVDLVTEGALSVFLREEILNEAQVLYEQAA